MSSWIIDLETYPNVVEAIHKEKGWTQDFFEACRNKGVNRTPEKREFLQKLEDRSLKAGRSPIKSYY